MCGSHGVYRVVFRILYETPKSITRAFFVGVQRSRLSLAKASRSRSSEHRRSGKQNGGRTGRSRGPVRRADQNRKKTKKHCIALHCIALHRKNDFDPCAITPAGSSPGEPPSLTVKSRWWGINARPPTSDGAHVGSVAHVGLVFPRPLGLLLTVAATKAAV